MITVDMLTGILGFTKQDIGFLVRETGIGVNSRGEVDVYEFSSKL